MRRVWSGVVLRMVLPVQMPALLIRMLGRPNVARTLVPTSAMWADEVMSHSKKRTLLGRPSSVAGGTMSRIATLISRSPSCWTMRRPIPLLPPVRITTSWFQLYGSLTRLFSVRLSNHLLRRMMTPITASFLRASSRAGCPLIKSRPCAVDWAMARMGKIFQGSSNVRDMKLPSTSAVKPRFGCQL